MLATCLMKVKETKEWDVPDLAQKLKAYADRAEKPVAQICREAEISTTFWYDILRGARDSIKKSTLASLCKALGVSLKDVGIDE